MATVNSVPPYIGVGCDSLSLNDITLWTGSPDTTLLPDGRANLALVRTLLSEGRYAEAEEANKSLQGHYSENYQPLGRVYIRRKCADDEATDYFGSLILAMPLPVPDLQPKRDANK